MSKDTDQLGFLESIGTIEDAQRALNETLNDIHNKRVEINGNDRNSPALLEALKKLKKNIVLFTRRNWFCFHI